MALSKQQQQQMIAGVLGAAAFGYIYFNYLFKPTNARIATLEVELADVLSQVENMKRVASRLNALQKESEQLALEVGQTEKRLPKEKNIQDVLRIITEESGKNNVSVVSFSPGGERPQSFFSEVTVSLSINGSLHSLGRFLTRLGQSERILSARGLNLSARLDPLKGHTVSGSFTLLTYYSKG